MITVLSPAKKLSPQCNSSGSAYTKPLFLDQSENLVEILKSYDPVGLQSLMGISQNLSELNWERYQSWTSNFSPDIAREAVYSFKGDTYTGLDADSLDEKDIIFAQDNVRILSGLYGVLKPLDLMLPYRLEMGTRLENENGKNLYEFWGDRITETLGQHLKASGSPVLVNLASNEYFKAVKPKSLDVEVITPQFRDLKNGQYKMISFFAKKARGVMARYIIQKGLNEPEGLKRFKGDGYYYSPEHSEGNNWVFLRDAPP